VTGQTATGGSVRRRPRATFRGSRAGWAPIVVLAAAATAWLLLAVGPASGQTITSKRQQAEAIVAQVDSMNAELEQTVEAWNYANIQLGKIDADLASNAKHLSAAKKSLVVAQDRIAQRLRDLYVNGQGDSTLEVILGAKSLDDIISRLDAIERVSSQDARILTTVKRYRKEVETRRADLRQAREDQAQIVAEQAAQKQSIESKIAEQNQLLASVKDEIAQMRAEEARRQAALAAQARAQAQAAAIAAQQAQQEVLDVAAMEPTYEPSYDPNLPAPRYGQVVGIALQYLGIPYVWGGSSPSTGFDCSGFVAYVYAQVGVSLPHHAASQYGYGTPVPYDQLAPGDLVFFSGLGHVGIYIGGGQFVHAPHTGDVVRISSLAGHGSYDGARRL
jgi:cell wall-associated NlpC family hydrolase